MGNFLFLLWVAFSWLVVPFLVILGLGCVFSLVFGLLGFAFGVCGFVVCSPPFVCSVVSFVAFFAVWGWGLDLTSFYVLSALAKRLSKICSLKNINVLIALFCFCFVFLFCLRVCATFICVYGL